MNRTRSSHGSVTAVNELVEDPHQWASTLIDELLELG